jgi:DNA helicase IV
MKTLGYELGPSDLLNEFLKRVNPEKISEYFGNLGARLEEHERRARAYSAEHGVPFDEALEKVELRKMTAEERIYFMKDPE